MLSDPQVAAQLVYEPHNEKHIIGLCRENAIAIESEARRAFAHKERNLHCDVPVDAENSTFTAVAMERRKGETKANMGRLVKRLDRDETIRPKRVAEKRWDIFYPQQWTQPRMNEAIQKHIKYD